MNGGKALFKDQSIIRPCAMVSTMELLAGTLHYSQVGVFFEEDLFRLIYDLEQALVEIRAIAVAPCPRLINEALRPTIIMMCIGNLISSCGIPEREMFRITPSHRAALQAYLSTRTVRIIGDEAAFRACGARLDEIVSERLTANA